MFRELECSDDMVVWRTGVLSGHLVHSVDGIVCLHCGCLCAQLVYPADCLCAAQEVNHFGVLLEFISPQHMMKKCVALANISRCTLATLTQVLRKP